MSSSDKKVGDQLTLVRNGFDGDETLFPQVTLKDNANVLIETVDLPHIADGIYRVSDRVMTNTPIIVAHSIVYKDAGHNIPHKKYGEIVHVFVRVEAVAAPNTELSGFVSNREDELSGSVENLQLSGEVSDNELSGFIEDEQLLGEVSSTELRGEVQEKCNVQ